MNFPIKKKTNNNFINKANLGMQLENEINESNNYYLTYDKAIIYKKPTPVQIVKVDYPMRSKAVITEAYYKVPSTTDYNGIYKGYYIDFEAKENHNKTAFPLVNIHPHQYTHLQNIYRHGGIGFIIIAWNHYNETYLLPIKSLEKFWKRMEDGGRKSITYDEIKENSLLIKEGYNPRIDYLKAIDYYLENNPNLIILKDDHIH